MSKLTSHLHVDVPSDEVMRRYRELLGGLGWAVSDQGEGVLEVREDATTLCCVEAPASARLLIEPRERGVTAVEITAKVPGVGPVSSRAVRSRMAFLVRAAAS